MYAIRSYYEQVEEETEQAKKKPKPKADEPKPDEPPKKAKPAEEQTKMAASDGGASAGRKKAEGVGVLKFKNAFKDLMKDRITSYNVCYTKLLRHRRYLDAENAYKSVVDMGAGLQFYELALYKLGWTVITSYSIHYTKLYEPAGS